MAKSGRTSLLIRKEALKFSAAHSTVFPDGTKEALHGHNYSTEIVARLAQVSLEKMISFSVLKKALRSICEKWDEKVLLAENCPFFKSILQDGESIEFTLCGKRYVLPTDEVELLPIDNTSSENLADEALRRLVGALKKVPEFSSVEALELRLFESPGQGASCVWERGE